MDSSEKNYVSWNIFNWRKKLSLGFAREVTFYTIFVPVHAVTCEISDLVDNIDGKHGKLNKYFEA
jgi:hypothetical protein